MPTIRKLQEHTGDPYAVGQWLRCTTTRATDLLATGAWVDADLGAATEAPHVAGVAEEKSVAPERNKMLEPDADK